MKPFEHTGFWWDPRDPDTRWPGTLRFDAVTGAVLTRTIAFHPSHYLSCRPRIRHLGDTTTAGSVTLLHCYEQSDDEVFANAVIVGFHASEPDPDPGRVRRHRKCAGTGMDRGQSRSTHRTLSARAQRSVWRNSWRGRTPVRTPEPHPRNRLDAEIATPGRHAGCGGDRPSVDAGDSQGTLHRINGGDSWVMSPRATHPTSQRLASITRSA